MGVPMEIYQIRLKALRWEISKFPSIAAFARNYQLDVTYVSQLLNGHRNLGERAARTFEAKFGWPVMSMDFLQEEWEMDEPVKETSSSQPRTSRRPGPSRKLSEAREIPLISSVQAGMWREVVDAYAPGAGQDSVIVHSDTGPHAFALKVRGNSMEPVFQEGDTIIIDPDLRPHPGDFVVARNSELEATFKKYRPRGIGPKGNHLVDLVALNEDYPTISSDLDSVQVIGTMIEHRRYRREKNEC